MTFHQKSYARHIGAAYALVPRPSSPRERAEPPGPTRDSPYLRDSLLLWGIHTIVLITSSPKALVLHVASALIEDG